MFERLKKRKLDNILGIKETELAIKYIEQVEAQTLKSIDKLKDRDEDDWVNLGGSTERELSVDDGKTMRQQASKFYYRNPHARNVIRLFEKYVVGRGFQISPMSTLEQVQEVWDEFWKVNKMDIRKKEIVRRVMRDGELFLRYFTKDGGLVIRFMNPDKINDPDNEDKIKGICSHGIETDKDDIENVLAYWYKGERIEAGEIEHSKILVDSDVKRGRSILEIIAPLLTLYNGWIKDRMKLNKVRSAIGLVKIVSGSPTQAANVATADRIATKGKLAPDKTSYHRAPEGVSVFTSNKGVEYKMLTPNLQASDVQKDGRALLLSAAAGVGMPEFMFSSDASNGSYACYHPNTEVLTKKGWQKIEKIRENQLIATVNPSTLELNYNRTKEVMEYDFNGELITFINQHMDIAVTPNHKMFITTRWQRKDLYQFREAQYIKNCWIPVGVHEKNIAEEQSNFILPEIPYKTHPEKNPGDRIINYDDWLSFLGYFISEGSTPRREGAYFLSISQRKSKIKAKIRELLKRLPFNFKETKDSFYTNDKSLWVWLHENCGARSETKKIPSIGMSNRQSRILLEALIDGDGHKPKNRSVMYYYSISSYLIDQIQVITTILGYATSRSKVYEEHIKEDGFKRFPLYKLSIRKPIQTHLKNQHISKMRYQGKVYCVEVPNHLIIVRRNGKVCISGNSTMIAEGPGVMEFEDWQDYFKTIFVAIFERVILFNIEKGRIPEKEKRLERVEKEVDGVTTIVEEQVTQEVSIECNIVFPDIVSRDIDKETKALVLQKNEGWLSNHTACAQLDLDYDAEQELIMLEEENETGGEETLPEDAEDEAFRKAAAKGLPKE